MNKVSTAKWSREEWQDWRQKVKTIGGSDAASVLGRNPYKSAYTLWAEKTGRKAPPKLSDSEAVRLGTDLEDYVARRWAEASGKKVKRLNAILSNSDYPWAHANIDRAVVGERDAGLECKTTASWEVIQAVRAGEIPAAWKCQCLHYMAVTGAKRWYLAVLCFGSGFFTFTMERNEADIAALMAAEKEFAACVERGEAPKIDGSQSSLDTLRSVFDKARDGVEIDLGGVQHELAEYVRLKEQIKQLDAQADARKAAVMAYMGSAEKGSFRGGSVTWKNQVKRSFNQKRFEADHGKIDGRYFDEAGTRVFRLNLKEEKTDAQMDPEPGRGKGRNAG